MQFSIPAGTQMIRGIPIGRLEALEKRPSSSGSGSGAGSTILYVSSKGLANGLSTTSNDGMAYGPDTPGTTTSGIQEAINALPVVTSTGENVGGGIIYLGQGQFSCSGQIIIPTNYQYELKIIGTGWHSTQLLSTGTLDFIKTATSDVLKAIIVSSGGTGYHVGDILAIPGGSGGTVTVATVSGTVITKVTVTTGGSGYSGATVTPTNVTGTGSGASLITVTTGKRANIILQDFKVVDATANGSTNRNLIRIADTNQGSIERIITVVQQCDSFTDIGNGNVQGQGGSDLYIGGIPNNAVGCVGIRIDGTADNKWVLRHLGGYGLAAHIILNGVDHAVIEDTMSVACGKWWSTPGGTKHAGTSWSPIVSGNIGNALTNALSYGAAIITVSNTYDIHCIRNYIMESSCAFMNLNLTGFGPNLRITEPFGENDLDYFLLNGLGSTFATDESLSVTSVFRQMARGAGAVGYINLLTGAVTTLGATTPSYYPNAIEFISGNSGENLQWNDLIGGTTLFQIQTTVSDINQYTDVTLNLYGQPAYVRKATLTGTVDGSNQTFTATKNPDSFLVDDKLIDKVSSSVTITGSGPYTITFGFAPNSYAKYFY